ncbi:class I SAM-dependent methyltransferase [Microbacterium sp.]|uniref:class I SAM-dependent methyltransferase n=1 Tax=Microbacterium sp. TaxID=51671 RepID=UPI002CAC9984|nr:methyltransferase domain-containing protein [Microbacterium sp.]HWL78347.1 methyltransferase domain-containing protein [Microbacterium sp.]
MANSADVGGRSLNSPEHDHFDSAGRYGTGANRELVWPGIESDFIEAVNQADTWKTLLGAIRAKQVSWPWRLTETKDAALAALPPVHQGAKALVIGGNWIELAPALSYLGADVIRADYIAARVKFLRLMGGQAREVVRLSLEEDLPWQDGSFATIFVDLVDLDRAGLQRADLNMLLREVRRVLAPDGIAIVATENPLQSRWWSWREGRTRLRACIGLVREVGLARVTRPWQIVAQPVGLEVVRALEPHPSLDDWELLLPPSPPFSRGRRGASVARAGRVHELAERVGAGILVAHHHILICRPSHQTPERSNAARGAIAAPRSIVRACSDSRAAIETGDEFLKVPLSDRQEAEVLDEVGRTIEAASGPWGKVATPWARAEVRSGVTIAVYPRLRASAVPLATYEDRLTDVLRGLPRDVAKLHDTELLRRIISPPVPENLSAGPLRQLRVEALSFQTRVVPVGPSHGDLDRANVLALEDGGIRIVDWQRSQPENPLFIDALSAAVDVERLRTGGARAEAFAAWTDGGLNGPLADLAYSLLGDLTRREACALLLLHEVTSYSFAWDESEPIEPDILKAAELLVDGSINSIP